jgi:hypothetical protein
MLDIAKSFTFLQDNIPQWLVDITAVEEKVIAMQADVVKTPAAMSPFVKEPSAHELPAFGSSIQRARTGAITDEAPASHGAQPDGVASRKRKSLSVSSGRASGPLRYRRTMVVLTYDGDMQKSLELLVRAIGTGRNLLRKAKMEAKLNELGALAGSSEDEEEADDDEDEDETAMVKISYRPRISSMRARVAARRGGAGSPVVLFDSTDKTLEHAQSLCEKAAHLILRDGDCRKEMGSVRKSLVDVLETAKTEVTKCDAGQLPELQEDNSHDTSDTSLSSAEPSYQRHFPQLSTPPTVLSPKNMLPCIPTTTSTAPHFMDIEVDDDDDEDEPEFVMPVRFTSRFAARA